jgi:hypothetical protein
MLPKEYIGRKPVERAGLCLEQVAACSLVRVPATTAIVAATVFSAACLSSADDKIPVNEDTTSPNMFWFSQAEYTADEGETNVTITVNWQAGNRGYSGWVDYAASDGTATADADFNRVSGRLYFSSPGPQSFVVPIHADCLSEGDETIHLSLSNSTAIITASNAVLKIMDGPCVPKIAISAAGNNMIMISWPAEFGDFILEKAATMNGPWATVASPYANTNGQIAVMEPGLATISLFRLKRAAP